MSATSKSYGTDEVQILQPGRGQTEARDVAAYLVRELTGARLREIGAAFAGLSQASVSLAASRTARRLKGDTALSRKATLTYCDGGGFATKICNPTAGIPGTEKTVASGRTRMDDRIHLVGVHRKTGPTRYSLAAAIIITRRPAE